MKTERRHFPRIVLGLVLGTLLLGTAPARAADSAKPVTVVIDTSLGSIRVALDRQDAPKTVSNFLQYVDRKYYDGTIFHRVIPGFMIQGGGFTTDYRKKPTKAPIANEAGNGLQNTRGTIAMARTSVIDSATSQFFINVADNHSLDHRNDTPAGYGYAVFGHVISGMDVVDRIVNVPTGARGPFAQNAPLKPVVIKSIHRLK